jgi:hypothetical protein
VNGGAADEVTGMSANKAKVGAADEAAERGAANEANEGAAEEVTNGVADGANDGAANEAEHWVANEGNQMALQPPAPKSDGRLANNRRCSRRLQRATKGSLVGRLCMLHVSHKIDLERSDQ